MSKVRTRGVQGRKRRRDGGLSAVIEDQQRPLIRREGSDEEDDLTAYDVLVSSLRPHKRPKMVETRETAVERSDEEEEDEEEEGEGVSDEEGGSTEAGEGTDPFSVHCESDLTEDVQSLQATLSHPLDYQESLDSVLGNVGQAVCLASRDSTIPPHLGDLRRAHVRQRLVSLWATGTGKEEGRANLSPLQQKIYAIVNSYKDLLFTRRTFNNGEEIRRIYILHALNHVLKTRSRVLKNNARLAHAAKEGRDMEEPRDQGFTRPKVLILLPFRDAAFRTVTMMINLLLAPGEGQVSYRKRFNDEFRDLEEYPAPKVPKPASHQAMFSGNIDDCFRIGVTVKRNVVKLYSEFYSSDIIIASPLGLRTIIGAEGEKSREYDFLSSLEVVIADQVDVFRMQNWEHLLHVFSHLHQQPRESHGVDFSRVRLWALNGWSKFYRQTILISSLLTPEINSLFNKHCTNFAGKVRVTEPSCEGSIAQVAVQVPQVFHRIDCTSFAELADEHFTYFVEKILPAHTGELMSQTAIYIPSYFDFVRIRNHMKREGLSFTQICEYTEMPDISRARSHFFHGRRHFLLLTERAHFFRRYRLRGIRHWVFYSLPVYPEHYPELLNMLETSRGEAVSCTVLYSRYDSLALGRIVGSQRGRKMVGKDEDIQTFLVGQH